MHFNTTYTMFLISLLISLIMISSSTSWLGIWLSLEINLMAFTPLLVGGLNSLSPISSLKYFLVQNFSSVLLLISIFLPIILLKHSKYWQDSAMSCSLLIKLGSSPFHAWLPSVVENLNWFNCWIILTLQKLGPLIALSNLPVIMFPSFIIILNLLVGVLGCLNQNSLRKFMAYSSISHNGWLIGGMGGSIDHWVYYFINYSMLNTTIMLTFSLMNTSFIHQWTGLPISNITKILIGTSFLSLGGMPPLMGFLPKWLIMEQMLETRAYLTMFSMILTSLLLLTLYLRIMYILFFSHSYFMKASKWKMNISDNSLNIMLAQLYFMVGVPILL